VSINRVVAYTDNIPTTFSSGEKEEIPEISSDSPDTIPVEKNQAKPNKQSKKEIGHNKWSCHEIQNEKKVLL
jgi:hypothetical protein